MKGISKDMPFILNLLYILIPPGRYPGCFCCRRLQQHFLNLLQILAEGNMLRADYFTER